MRKKKKDEFPDEEILAEIIEEAEKGELSQITDEDIINMILIDFYSGEPIRQIAEDWELTEDEVEEIIRSFPLSKQEIKKLRQTYLEELDEIETEEVWEYIPKPTSPKKYKH
jgi:energy-converting hydrogenase A subunit M